MKDKAVAIFNHFGLKEQTRKLNEECYELCEVLLQLEQYKYKDLVSEIADIQVLLNEIKLFFGVKEQDVIKEMEFKIDRTLKRIETGYYDKSTKVKEIIDRM